MNDTGGGVTAIHDVPGDITRIGFHWMLFFPFCHSKGVSSICSSHGESRKVTGVLCPEFSNFRIFSSHGVSRNNLFITNYRIIFTRNVAEDHGFFFTLNVGSAEVWVTRRGGVGACFCM